MNVEKNLQIKAQTCMQNIFILFFYVLSVFVRRFKKHSSFKHIFFWELFHALSFKCWKCQITFKINK